LEKHISHGGVGSSSEIFQGHLAPPDDNIDCSGKVRLNSDLLYANLHIVETVQETDLTNCDDVEAPILDALENYLNNPSIPLHIPGHAKGKGVLPRFKSLIGQKAINLDTTDEFDNLGTLHPADGPVAKAQELAAEVFGAEKSYFLVNGSTVGNLALALTAAKENKKVIIGRNCHRSIIGGLVLTGSNPIWVIPERLDEWGLWGEVKPETIAELLDENPDAGVVWITNPTYEGVISDVKAIAEICKEREVTLIVDEAHGCHWKFNDNLPVTALECGADAVVHSMHKTGGSFAQSSIVHLNKNSRINADEFQSNLRMLQSTSPSYILLASIDAARAFISSREGRSQLHKAVENASEVRNKLKSVPGVRCLSYEDGVNIDPTKIYIMIDGLSGKRLESLLEIDYRIEVEAATDNGVLALSNIGNTAEELDYFCECIKSIVNTHYSDITYLEKTKYMPFYIPEIVCTPRKAYVGAKERVAPSDSVGRISAQIIAECPPGIPILVPGEKITAEHLPFLTKRKSIWVSKEF